jgi:hypothetical protein
LFVYQTDAGTQGVGFYFYNGTDWAPLGTINGSAGIAGNTGTVDGTSFIGTTDNVPFNVRVNNIRAARIDHIQENTLFGFQAGLDNTTGSQNTFIGNNTGRGITTGINNTILGAGVTGLASGLAGNIILADGAGNIKAQQDGTDWTLTGGLTAGGNAYPITPGVAGEFLVSNGAGTINWGTVAAAGAIVLPLAVTDGGTGLTIKSFVDLTTVQNNINGAKTFIANVTVPTLNTLTVGIGPGAGNPTNTAIGISALAGNTSAVNVTAIGHQALGGNTTGGSGVAVGYQALKGNTTGVSNTATGSQALYSTTTGGFNTAFGGGALYTNTGIGNTATGYQALYSNAGGLSNTANGYQALFTTAAGGSNTAIGYQAGYENAAGTKNTYIGYNTGRGIASGTENTILGANVTGLAAALDGNIILADGAGSIKAQYSRVGATWTLTGGLTAGGITYPTVNGTNTQVLITNGAGTVSWGNVVATSFSGILPVASGGTGSATQNFVDLTTAQTINGTKTFVSDAIINNLTIGHGLLNLPTNTAIGTSTLTAISTSVNVTAIGYQALMGNTTGGSGVAVGYQALKGNTTGVSNTATGSQALFSTTTGGFNTAFGSGALYTNTGIGNTATGYQALYSNAAGLSNTANGYQALFTTAGGGLNTAIGYQAGYDNAGGTQNTYIGYNTGRGIVSGAENTILGANVTGLAAALAGNIILADGAGSIKAQYSRIGTLWTLTGGLTAGGMTYPTVDGANTNVLITNGAGIASWGAVVATSFNGILPVANGGTGSATQNFVDLTTTQTISGVKTFASDPIINTLTVGTGVGNTPATNTAIGVSALAGNTTAVNVTAVGYQALMGNTTASSTVAVGYQALKANTTGVSNTATGSQALFSTTTGGFNTAYGSGALYTNTGVGNTATGYQALYSNAAGLSNTAIGYRALFATAAGGLNTAIGYQAGHDNAAGARNTYIGYNTGRGITSGTNNTILGANVIGLAAALTGNIILADGAGIAGSIKAQYSSVGTLWTLTGNIKFGSYGAGTLTTDASGNITASSDERLKNINGNYKKGLAELLNIKPIVYHWNELSGNDTLNTYAGFSAQNIKESLPEAVGMDPRGYLTLSDRPILAATVNAIKEMNITINEQQNTITRQQLAIEKMETEMMKLKTMVMSLNK